MFDKIFSLKNIESNANYALFAGVFFTIFSFIVSYLLFNKTPYFVGVSTVLLTVVLAMPVVMSLFKMESFIAKKTFLSKTRHILDFYIYFFIGSFVVFFLIALIAPGRVFSEAQLFGSSTSVILPQNAGIPPPPIDSNALFMGIFSNNLYVMIIAFILSLLYGAGSLLLLMMNSSIFAFALADVIRQSAGTFGQVALFSIMACNMGVMFFHMIPEVIAYFLAAIAGCVLSFSVSNEKLFSSGFFKTLRYAVLIFISSIIMLVVGALIESKISWQLLTSGTCLRNTATVLIITLILLIVVVVSEVYRKKHS